MTMRFAAAAAVLATAAAAGSSTMHRHTMEELASSTGARCLDGTPGVFYYSNHTVAASSNNWLIYHEGGGWCYDAESCLERSRTRLGSSKTYTVTIDSLDGMWSRDCTTNPVFCTYNHVYMKYCDGNSFSGDRHEPHPINGTHLFFRGKRILDAVLDTLVAQYGLGDAANVLYSGGSAGGLAAYLHADYVHEYVAARAQRLQRFKVAPSSGFFLDHANLDNQTVYQTEMREIFALSNASSNLNAGCLAAYPASEHWRCNMAPYTYPHVKAPVLVMNSAMDSWQSGCVMAAKLPANFPDTTTEQLCNAFPTYKECVEHPATHCPADQVGVFNEYRDAFMAAVSASSTYTKPGNGAFLYSCHLHVAELHGYFSRIRVNGTMMNDALAKWWDAPVTSPASEHTYTPCYYKTGEGVTDRMCNPTCPRTSEPVPWQ